MNLNIVWITPDFPHPPTSGVVGIYNRIKELSNRGHSIYLFAVSNIPVAKESISELRNYCKGIFTYKINTYETIYNLFTNPLIPLRTLKRFSKKVQKDINSFLRSNNINVLIIEHSVMGVYLPKYSHEPLKRVLMIHTIVHKAWLDSIKFLPFFSFKKLIFYIEAFKTKRLEHKIFNRDEFDEYWLNSKTEIQDIVINFPKIKKKTKYIPLGLEPKVDLEVRSYEGLDISPTTKMILNIGSMDNPSNEDAARWFGKEIFPRIKYEVPEAKFYIVGKSSSHKLKDIVSEDVIVVGEVKDLKPYLNRCDLYVIPQRSGGGVRTKFIDGLSARRIIVSTTIGVEGVEGAEQGKNFLLAQNEDEFVKMAIDVLKSPKKYKETAENGFNIFTTFHTLKVMGDRLEEYLMNLKGNIS